MWWTSSLTAIFDRAAADRAETRPALELAAAYVADRDAIEADLGASHDVSDDAERPGSSARTLSRACQQATGQTARGVLADRLLLGAQRLLVRTDMPASAIAAELGFSEATSPGESRRSQR